MKPAGPHPGNAGPVALIDALKAGACCLIVLHHLAFYGPMADHADELFPALFEWLENHARLAVQVFLVMGGYLAARALPLDRDRQGFGLELRAAVRRVGQRFLRLALPVWATLMLAIVCNGLADHWMDHPSISAAPNLLQVASHLLLLQDLTGHEALSAGLWYVAIDFQLYAMLSLMVLCCRAWPDPQAALQWACLLLTAASAFFFNREANWDVLAPYFWCSYGLGVLIGLKASPRMLMVLMGVVLAALAIDWRTRLLVAGLTAGALWWWLSSAQSAYRLKGALIPGLSRISYAVFLVHFPVSLVVNAAWVTFLPTQAWLQFLGVVTAFKLSLLAGWAFHRWVEQPLVRRASGWMTLQPA